MDPSSCVMITQLIFKLSVWCNGSACAYNFSLKKIIFSSCICQLRLCGGNCLSDRLQAFGDMLEFTTHYGCTLSDVFGSALAFKCFINAELWLFLWGFSERLINDLFFPCQLIDSIELAEERNWLDGVAAVQSGCSVWSRQTLTLKPLQLLTWQHKEEDWAWV